MRRPPSLWPRLALGACLLGPLAGLAHAGGKPTIEQIRQRMDQSIAMQDILRHGVKAAFKLRIAATFQGQGPHVIIKGTAQDGIAVSVKDGALLAVSDGRTRAIDATTLRSHALFQHHELDRLIEAQLTTPAAAPRPAPVESWKLKQHLERSRDAFLLAEAHRLLLLPRKLSQGVTLAQDHEGSLRLDTSERSYEGIRDLHLVHLDAHGALHATQLGILDAKSNAFERLGLGSEQALEARLSQALIDAAVRAGAREPTLDAAREELHRQLTDARLLEGMLHLEKKELQKLPAEAVQLLVEARGKDTGYLAKARVTVAGDAREELQLAASMYRREGAITEARLEVVTKDSTKAARPATLADLHHFGIDSTAAYAARLRARITAQPDRAAAKARLELAEALRTGLPRTPELELLERYRELTQLPSLALFRSGKYGFALDGTGSFRFRREPDYASLDDTFRYPTTLDFERNGIRSVDDLKLMHARALLEHAGVQGDPSKPADVAKARAAMEKRMGEIATYLKSAQHGDDAQLLVRHRASAGTAREGWDGFKTVHFYQPVYLSETPTKVLVWSDGKLRTIPRASIDSKQISMRGTGSGSNWVINGKGVSEADNQGAATLKETSYADLLEFKLPDQAALDRAVHKLLAEAAGLPERTAVARLRQVLHEQDQDVPRLRDFIAGKNEDAHRLLAISQQGAGPLGTSAGRGSDSKTVVLAKHDQGDLVLGDGSILQQPVLRVGGKEATIGDLRRIGVGTVKALEALVHDKMLDLAPEDYD